MMEAKQIFLYIYWLPRVFSQSLEAVPVHPLVLKPKDLLQGLWRPGLNHSRVGIGPVKLHFRSRRQVAAAANGEEKPPEIMEENNDKYDPNWGYEPYWPAGDWVFVHKTTKGTTVRTTTLPKLCGNTCNYLMKPLGPVCGHRQDEADVKTGFKCPHNTCKNVYLDDLFRFTTFNDYCHFLQYQCESKVNEKWLFVHMGKCEFDNNILYKPLIAWQPVSRAQGWRTDASRLFARYTSRTIGWGK